MMCKLEYLLLIGLVSLGVSCSSDSTDQDIDHIYKPTPVEPEKPPYFIVPARTNSTSTDWRSYTAQTVARIPEFKIVNEPERSIYGGWIVPGKTRPATGFFRTEKIDNRWWIIDPEGNQFIHKAIAVFNPGSSDRQKAALTSKFGSTANWAKSQTDMIKANGFNGVGSWSNVGEINKLTNPPAFCVFLEPAAKLKNYLKANGEPSDHEGWEGYQWDIPPVFFPQIDEYIDREIKTITQYRDNQFLLGYFVDNELPWKNDALGNCLDVTKFPKTHVNNITAQTWLDARKGRPSTIADANASDKSAFTAFMFETFISKVEVAIRKYDPNHLFLGTKFNQEKHELINPDVMKVAGQYVDVITVDHYRSWEPNQTMLQNWVSWSGKPFMIVEFYVKGEDSGLPNKTGAGWNVATQAERGYFYQNFTIELIKSKGCVGWHWFTYQDNDPENMNTDPSNRDSNKGIVTWDFNEYSPLLSNMKELNENVYQLTRFYDK